MSKPQILHPVQLGSRSATPARVTSKSKLLHETLLPPALPAIGRLEVLVQRERQARKPYRPVGELNPVDSDNVVTLKT